MSGLADPLFPSRSTKKSRRLCKWQNGRHKHGVWGKGTAQGAEVYTRMHTLFFQDEVDVSNVLANRDICGRSPSRSNPI